MPQAPLKKSKAAGSGSRRPNVLGPKKGARTIKPKNAVLVRNRSLLKKHTSGLTAKTEHNLAQKAGHLEMLAGGKARDKSGGAGGKGKKVDVDRGNKKVKK
ncbi:MAG: hypothetical protein M1817_002227 [Caeruleum heppii]|nr:MAG: hypothetical protein M1817_002227 [Caeruleum heppii]